MYRQGTLYADSQCKLGVQETGRDWTAVAKVNLTPGGREEDEINYHSWVSFYRSQGLAIHVLPTNYLLLFVCKTYVTLVCEACLH